MDWIFQSFRVCYYEGVGYNDVLCIEIAEESLSIENGLDRILLYIAMVTYGSTTNYEYFTFIHSPQQNLLLTKEAPFLSPHVPLGGRLANYECLFVEFAFSTSWNFGS